MMPLTHLRIPGRRLLTFLLAAALLIGCHPAIAQLSPTPTLPPVLATSAVIARPLTGATPAAAFNEFLETAYADQLRRDPETATEMGLAEKLGLGQTELTNVSNAYQLETYALLQQQLDELHLYERASLTPAQQLSYDVFEWYLQDKLAGKPYRFYDYLINQVYGAQVATVEFLTDRHPFQNAQNARDYVERVKKLAVKMDQAVDWLKAEQAAGVIPPAVVLSVSNEQVQDFKSGSPRLNRLYTAFKTKAETVKDLSPDEKDLLTESLGNILKDEVYPAYGRLGDQLQAMQARAAEASGLAHDPNGSVVYAYFLRHHTTTDQTAEQIHNLGRQEVSRIRAEMEREFAQAGINGGDWMEKVGRLYSQSGFLEPAAAEQEYRRLIEQTRPRLDALFNLQPQAEVTVITVNAPGAAGAYYVAGALDGSRPGAFYINNLGAGGYRCGMPTLVYHEAIPGHHWQVALQQEQAGLPTFRRSVVFGAFAEGWALYAEKLAAEAGFYQGNPAGNLCRLQAELHRAVRLVVDTGLHAQGWSRLQAIDYFVENVGYGRDFATAEVNRFIAWPGQATAYKVGELAILTLRQQMKDQLKEDFDLKAFHTALLQEGSLPLDLIAPVVLANLK